MKIIRISPSTVHVVSSNVQGIIGLTAFFLLSLFVETTSADQLWVHAYDGFGGDNNPYSMALDSTGNVIVTGSSKNQNGNDDIYTAKYGAGDGGLLWEVRYDGPAGGDDRGTSVAVDSANNVIVTGYSGNGNDPNGNSPADFYTAKYDPAGHLIWERRGPYSPPDFLGTGVGRVNRVAVDSEGNVVVSGTSNGQAPCCQISFYTVKYAGGDGSTLWEKWYVGPGLSDFAIDLVLDRTGNAIVTGRSSCGCAPTHYGIETLKYAAADGQVLWSRRYSSADADESPIGIAVDEDGNVFLNGARFQEAYHTFKYAAVDGSVLWQSDNFIPVDGAVSRDFVVPQSIVADSEGNIVVNQRTSQGPRNLAKYSGTDGHLIWSQRFQLGNCSTDPYAIALDNADNVIVAGDFGGPHRPLLAKYDSTDGHLLWQQTASAVWDGGSQSPFQAATRGVRIDPSGNVTMLWENRTTTGNLNLDYLTLRFSASGNPLITVTCPANIVTGTDPSQCSAVVNYTTPTVTDPCGHLLAVTCTPPPGAAFLKGTTTVTCTASDGSTCSFTVTVTDSEKPVITCPANIITSIACGQSSTVVSYPTPQANDNCYGVTVTCDPPSGSLFPTGNTTVHCTATDASGNTASCSFTVTVGTSASTFQFNGFLSPIGGADAGGGSFTDPIRTFKLKSTIPVKFTAACGGSPVLQAIKYSNQTTSDAPIDATPTDAATTGNQFRLTGEEWHFNLDTKATGMSAGIWLLRATLSDGSEHSVWIQIK